MKLGNDQCENFFSHFPVVDSLTAQECIAVLQLVEDGVDYFVTDRHVTREVFGAAHAQSPQQYVGELAISA